MESRYGYGGHNSVRVDSYVSSHRDGGYTVPEIRNARPPNLGVAAPEQNVPLPVRELKEEDLMKKILPDPKKLQSSAKEVRLWDDQAERRKVDEGAQLFAILKATDHLEKAFLDGLCTPEQYERECGTLILHYQEKADALQYKPEDVHRFIAEYHMSVESGIRRLLIGKPATHGLKTDEKVIKRGKIIASISGLFVTVMDYIEMGNKSADQVEPALTDLVSNMMKFGIPFDGKDKIEQWLSVVKDMPAHGELNDQQTRSISRDLLQAYNGFHAALESV
mmetsp:Transcript_10650/g.21441  ORF Transcript_10650/g.21441 Transcript_10650/m.21441 type:complete len:278 (+) Transcript_10650:2136-2969(+)